MYFYISRLVINLLNTLTISVALAVGSIAMTSGIHIHIPLKINCDSFDRSLIY